MNISPMQEKFTSLQIAGESLSSIAKELNLKESGN